METISFRGTTGFFHVVVGLDAVDREQVWFESVCKKMLSINPAMLDAALFNEYHTAGSRSCDAVRTKARYRKVKTIRECTFVPTAPKRRKYNEKRAAYREFRNEVELHWQSVSTFIGTLFSSWRSFKLANSVLAFQPASAVPNGGRRRRVRAAYDVTLPHFGKLTNFTDDLITWAATRLPMGSLVSQERVIMDSLCQVACYITGFLALGRARREIDKSSRTILPGSLPGVLSGFSLAHARARTGDTACTAIAHDYCP